MQRIRCHLAQSSNDRKQLSFKGFAIWAREPRGNEFVASTYRGGALPPSCIQNCSRISLSSRLQHSRHAAPAHAQSPWLPRNNRFEAPVCHIPELGASVRQRGAAIWSAKWRHHRRAVHLLEECAKRSGNAFRLLDTDPGYLISKQRAVLGDRVNLGRSVRLCQTSLLNGWMSE